MSGHLDLPGDLDAHAKTNANLYHHLICAMRASDGLVQDALYFFPEYTDHGKSHVQAVWSAAFGLIPSEAKDKGKGGPFTDADACILAMAVLLHDIAMHLHLEGFKRLIAEDSPWRLDGEDAQAPNWAQLWRDYQIEAGRWDGDRIVKVLGDGVATVPKIDLSGNDLSKPERMLVGEFLRRHHPRLAHEIARHGFPDAAGAKPILGSLDRHHANLAGLIARSHGMALRDGLDRLRRAGRHREFQGVHALYLMALLRVADFVQLQADRAPAATLRQIKMDSRVSRLEWKTHAAILDIRESDDAEAITIEIDPVDVHALLRAREWVDGLQEELDKSWAVLGEVYGTRQPLCQLGLRFRRVHSQVTEGLSFHAEHARFRLAGSDTIKLLIGPLYGHKPEVGIRELMQNAVDAVRERDLVEREADNLDWARKDDWDVDVHIDLDAEGKPEAVVVRDNGIGMTAATVLNYFLVAGATFRRSDSWRDRFEEKPGADGKPGKVKVLRAGRFGVGALAAFLIGDEIEVTTRHRDAAPQDAVHFTAHVDDYAIQLNRVLCAEVGTTIRVKIGERQRQMVARLLETASFGDWDWFCHSWPRVRRGIGEQEALAQSVTVAKDWFPVPGTDYEAVTFLPRLDSIDGPDGQLICNGVKVCESDRAYWHTFWGMFNAVRAPHVDIIDLLGLLKLTMRRDALDGDVDLVRSVVGEFTRHLIADCLATGPTERWGYYNMWALAPEGFMLALPRLLSHFAGSEIWFVPSGIQSSEIEHLLTAGRMVVPQGAINATYALAHSKLGKATVISKYNMNMSQYDWELIARDGEWRISAHPERVHPYAQLLDYLKTHSSEDFVAAAICDTETVGQSGAVPAQVWLDLIGPRFIPLDLAERQKQLPDAFAALAPLIEHYAKLGATAE